MESLYYPGAFVDNSFLKIDEFKGVTTFVLCDGLPNSKYFKENTHGYKSVKNEETFLKTLCKQYGELVFQLGNELRFKTKDGRTVIYHMNTDANKFKSGCTSIYFSGYEPDKSTEKYKTLYVSCNHVFGFSEFSGGIITVHPCKFDGECCGDDIDVESDSEEEEDADPVPI